ncbi:MAG: hypothetical protein Q4G40_07700 [Brachybacterium sp.]|nr:hypothetical protein [Brachybacterium sp.]
MSTAYPPPPPQPGGDHDPQQATHAPDGTWQPVPTSGGPAPGTDIGSDIGAGFSFAWNGFVRNLATFLVPALVYTLVIIGGSFVIAFAAPVIMAFSFPDPGQYEPGVQPEFPVGAFLVIMAITLVFGILIALLTMMWYSGIARAAGIVRDGGRPSIGQGFIGTGRIIATSLLVGLITFVATMVFVIPGLIAGFLLLFAIPAAASGASPGEAMRESFRLTTSKFLPSLLTVLVIGALSSVGSMVLIGMLVTVPLSVLLLLGMYERLSGRTLVDPQPAAPAAPYSA